MTTIERAEHLAAATARFPFLTPAMPDDLIALIEADLGDAEMLDRFVVRGGRRLRAAAFDPVLHIVAGNTPAAALQSLVRGLLLGGHQLCKIPSKGLPEVTEFRDVLPASLASRLEISRELTNDWLTRAEAIVVFGSDETIARFRGLAAAHQRLIEHGHKISFAAIFDDDACASVDDCARDVSTFDQLGCLSPQVIYVAKNARHYAEKLAGAMQRFQEKQPRGAISLSSANLIRCLREDYAFRAANEDGCALWQSEGSTAWTVVFTTDPGFPQSPLRRTIFVKPLSGDLAAELSPLRAHLSCAGIFPCTKENATRLAQTGVTRICPIGRMQKPPWTWRQDGLSDIASLVRWISSGE
jgi:hypothetical protein